MSALTPSIQVDSPFLPDTKIQYAWDSVSLTAALSCWRRYQLSILQGWRPKGEKYAIALTFGIAFHKGLELYHLARLSLSHEDAVELALKQLMATEEYDQLPTSEELAEMAEAEDEDDDGISLRNAKVRTRYHLVRSVVWYLDHYKDDRLETVLLPSGKPAVEVSFRLSIPAEINQTPAILSGHCDRIVSHHGHLHILDYKTTKSLSRQFFASYQLSHQLTGYIYAGKSIMHKPALSGMIDGIALKVGGADFRRQPTNRSPGQIAEYLETFQHVLDEAARMWETHGENDYPMNTSACYFCDFKPICSHAPEVRKLYLRQHYTQEKSWNPLESR